jgi:prepilin-type processing-associated H-X9-DG protein
MDDPTVSIMPFLSDWTVERKGGTGSGFVGTGGGHRWGGSLKNNNAAYVDGHVETRSAKQLQWQAESPTGLIYLY